MNTTSANGIEIVAVTNSLLLRYFIELPWSLYQEDTAWVPPLLFEIRQRLNRKKNPFFEHARMQMWLALRDGKPVGRISAQVDQLHQQQYNDKTGYFGMLEVENNIHTSTALFNAAETWLCEQNMQRVCGPFNLSINGESGLLIEGFDTPPSVMMGHSLPYTGGLVEAAGYQKAKDLLAFTYDAERDTDFSPTQKRIFYSVSAQVKMRPFNRKQTTRDLDIIRDIFNNAWSENWGYVPWSDAEFKDIGKLLLTLLDDDLIQIAELEGVPAAFIVAMPDINEAAKDLNGRLLPFGWLKLLWRLKVSFPRSARIPLMGVKKQFHNTILGPALAVKLIDAIRIALVKRKVTTLEMSWILEDNKAVSAIIETCGGKVYKRYRLYDKALR